MELRPRYKETVVGSIPEEWGLTKVCDIASSARNAIVGGPFGSDLVSSDYVEDGVPVIRGQNMSRQWISGNFVFVTPIKAKSLEANLARPQDIVFTQRGTLGQVSLVPEGPHPAYLISQSQMKVSVNLTVADPLFYYYVFKSGRQQELICGETIQTGVPHINLGILRDIPVQLPPLHEQRAIAAALSDVDALIASLAQLIAKKRDIKQAAIQELVSGRRRLPGYSEAWKDRTLGDLFTFKNGLNKGKEFFGYGTPIVNYMDVFSSSAVSPKDLEGRVSVDKAELQNFDVQTGDVFFTRTSETTEEIGMAAVIVGEPENTVFSGFVLRARPTDDSLCDSYKAFCFQSYEIRKQIISTASYTTRALTNGKLLSTVRIRIPSKAEQTAIAAILTDMDEEILSLQRKLDKTIHLKQGMMQELLTGRIRLV